MRQEEVYKTLEERLRSNQCVRLYKRPYDRLDIRLDYQQYKLMDCQLIDRLYDRLNNRLYFRLIEVE